MQYLGVVIFTMLYKVVLKFESLSLWMKFGMKCAIQMKGCELYFSLSLLVYYGLQVSINFSYSN